MTKKLWLNLPVKDIKRSTDFFTALGFEFNTQHCSENAACLLIGEDKTVVMLFNEITFKGFIGNDEIASGAAEILLSIDAESKEEVDAMAAKAVAAGGSSDHMPKEMADWMYGSIFSDPDGHRWNVLHMDIAKMPL